MTNWLHNFLLAAATLLLLLGLAHQHGRAIETLERPWQNKNGVAPSRGHISPSSSHKTHSFDKVKRAAVTPWLFWWLISSSKTSSFQEIATKFGTDKVTTHNYWYMYDKYLEPLRNKKLKMLEIGLGCDMHYGPGKSYYTWLEYFPNVELYYVEYDAACAEKWSAKTGGATIYSGDQADKEFLHRFIAESGGNFDIIIDDGGHEMNQQRVSLEELWKIVKPGGIYFCEDLQTSFMPDHGGDGSGGKDPAVDTMMKFIYRLMDDKMTDGSRHPISKDMRSIDCMKEICAFTKKEAGTI